MNEKKYQQQNKVIVNKILYYAPCPAKNCLKNNNVCLIFNHYKNKKQICEKWFITVKGNLICEKCNYEQKYVNATFNCINHESEYPYKEGALHSIERLQSNIRNNKNKEFFKQLKANLEKQFG